MIHILDDDVIPSQSIPQEKIEQDVSITSSHVGHSLQNKTTPDKKTTNKNVSTMSLLNNNTINISQQTLDKLARFSRDSKEVTPPLDVSDKKNILTSKDCSEEVPTTKVKKSIPSKTLDTSQSLYTSQKKESLPSYTPLEKQVMELRKQSHGALLFVECGYKYRFFGSDAEVRTF